MNVIPEIMEEINRVMAQVDEAQLHEAMNYLTKERRIFVYGEGRSGFQGKGFAMRLMHIGYQVYVVGETIAPSLQKGDVMVSISGSGTTKGILEASNRAKQMGVQIIGVTSNRANSLAELSDQTIIVPGATKADDGTKSIQLLSTLFDQTVHITLDALCLLLSRRDHTTNDMAKNQHTNME